MTAHRMTELRKTQHRMTERQKFRMSKRTQRRIWSNVEKLNIESTQRRKVLNVERLKIEFEHWNTEHRKIPLLYIMISLLNLKLGRSKLCHGEFTVVQSCATVSSQSFKVGSLSRVQSYQVGSFKVRSFERPNLLRMNFESDLT
jgi:hypothetical protein